MQSRQRPQSSWSGAVGLDLDVGDERSEDDPGAVFARDQHRVLAEEADARTHRALAVDVLVLVHEHAIAAAELAAEGIEALAQEGVVVAPCVAWQPPLPRLRLRALDPVAESGRDDRPRLAVQQQLGVAGDLGLRHREPHAGEEAALAALEDVRLGLLVRPGRGRAGHVEAEVGGSASKLCGRHERIVP